MSSEKEDKILPGEIKALPDREEILKLLECPCCLEPPVPPIKTCVTGHIICSFCRPRLTRCAICREAYTESRSYPLETIFNGCTIACKFWGRGCQQIIKGSNYIDHVKICQYRALCCSHCQDSISPVDQYIHHLKEKHNAFGYDKQLEEYQCKNIILNLENDIRFPDQYALYDGNYFIVSVQIRSHFFIAWISIVQNLSESVEDKKLDDESMLAEIRKRAAKVNYTAIITIVPEEHSLPLVKWTIPILPLQNGEPDPALIVNIPVNPTLKGFLTCAMKNESETIDGGGAQKYSCCFKYCICKGTIE